MLERFSLLHTADVDEFRVAVGQYLTPHKLAPAGRVATLENDLAMAALGPVTLVYGRNAGAVLQVQLTEQVDYYDVNLALAGTNLVRTGGEEVLLDARTAGILSPRMLASMQLSDGYRQLHVRVERYALERQLEELLGRPVPGPIRFRPGMDLTDPAAASWSQAVQLLVRDLNEPAGLAGTAAGPSWAAFLMTGLLLAQPHNYTGELEQRRSGPRRPASVKRVLDLIERDPSAALPLDRLALAAGVTARSLQRYFKEYVGCSPQAYLRSVRLARAHEELKSAPPGTTVADIAFNWGFTHLPRFASAYQERYGVPPSATLRGT
ncbi:AraC family transcriptional regulator [Amycolatopsis bartoniae]|nr:AraC family transcriptional regulator [Amycolatopsis bartoniae]TVT10237.1 AraC family transcriptional regulator [Amycolatopsis bartoniae]